MTSKTWSWDRFPAAEPSIGFSPTHECDPPSVIRNIYRFRNTSGCASQRGEHDAGDSDSLLGTPSTVAFSWSSAPEHLAPGGLLSAFVVSRCAFPASFPQILPLSPVCRHNSAFLSSSPRLWPLLRFCASVSCPLCLILGHDSCPEFLAFFYSILSRH